MYDNTIKPATQDSNIDMNLDATMTGGMPPFHIVVIADNTLPYLTLHYLALLLQHIPYV